MSPRLSTRLALAALLTLFLNAPAWAEWRGIAYKDVAKMPLTLKKVDPQGVYSVFYRAQPGKGQTGLPGDLQFRVNAAGQAVPVPVLPDGRMELPIRQDWADSDAQLEVNQPKGRVQVSFNLTPRVPAGTQMSYSQLSESAPVMERGIKEMAGMMSFMAPKVRALALRFDKGNLQTVTLTLPDGKKKLWKTDAEGRVELPWDPTWSRALVQLTAPLREVGPVLK